MHQYCGIQAHRLWQNQRWLTGFMQMLGVGVLLVACAAPAAPAAPAGSTAPIGPTAAGCRASGPAACEPALVVADLARALAWYAAQAAQIEQTHAYPPTMLADFAEYYTGDMLHTAQAALTHTAQAGQVVAGRWERLTIEGHGTAHGTPGVVWLADGAAQVRVQVQGYWRSSYPAPAEQAGLPLAGGITQRWQYTLHYDAAAQRWKIADARRVGD
ncbi:MAG: hypothetical protein HC911_16075 [Chloroflexaceae bacterium]|nr:hypothetical protein [Chloroflexaceae bacterium]